MWLDNGSPAAGLLFDLMKQSKSEYKYKARAVLNDQQRLSSHRMSEALHRYDCRNLWSEVKCMNGVSKLVPDKIVGVQGPAEICDLFADKYNDLYNCVHFDKDEMSRLTDQLDAASGFVCDRDLCYAPNHFSVADACEECG
jgi:hypothetical protein